jgi:two-component system, OmpR family, phosphate regulon response regulator PhoB
MGSAAGTLGNNRGSNGAGRTSGRAIGLERPPNLRKLLSGAFLLVRSCRLILLVRCENLPIRNWEGCRNEDGVPPTVTGSEAAGIRHEVEKDEARMTKILLVDDSKFLRLATERALARAGYEVSTAMDGANALEIAREKKPDLILLDMLLPKMTGPDVLKALKNDPATARIAVVAFTGLSQKNAVRLEQDGAFAFLEKAELGLDKGSEALLVALARIVRRLKLEVPGGTPAK